MPGFTLSASCRAPVEEVWKLLFDPARFPDWWVGIETVRKDSPDEFTQWPTGYPDFPMPQKLRVDQASDRVTISCQVSDIDVVWQLAEAGTGSSINVKVSLPEREAYRLDGQHQAIEESLRRLTALAESAS
jgi:Polyketide cyclase / dehydrase and lipid transport